MRSLHVNRWLASILVSLVGAILPATMVAAQPTNAAGTARPVAPPTEPSSSGQFVDGIAAVVNKQVITLRQLDTQAQVARQQMQQQNVPIPPDDVLQKQVLQRMITQELERQEADRLGIRVTDVQAQRAVQTIAQRNKLTEAQLRAEIEKSGVTWDAYLDNLRQEVRMDMLRQRAVDSSIQISDAEIDAYLRNQKNQGSRGPLLGSTPAQTQAPAASAGPDVLGIAQILVAVPEGASSAQVQQLRQKAEALLAKVRGGADFAGVAAASSDGPQALEGGVLGVRPTQGWPDLFINATRNLAAGQISDIVQSGNGFHILKVLTRGEPSAAPAPAQARPAGPPTLAGQQAPAQHDGPMMVTQTHARHILIKVSQVMSDEQARTRLEQLRQRILNGEDFADLAKRYSEDASAPQGGDLGWLSPGETVPAFEQVMNSLQPNQISEPIRSQFGWHLIQVLERRNKDMGDEYKRMQARQALFERRLEPAFDDWLSQLRGQAYIDNRLDPSSNSGRR
ncbi:molecular chaperone SurA [Allopusillimonas ginsengisoli]|nr:molecular chaperone SurA [Allopusillimonas ginsengisoli]